MARIAEGKAKIRRPRQRGFMLLELIVVMGIIGVLAMIAVPRFTHMLTMANTARVQADLQVINSSIVLYQAERGTLPTAVSDLGPYIADIAKLKPPSGVVYLYDGTTVDVGNSVYSLSADRTQGVCANHVLSDFGTQK